MSTASLFGVRCDGSRQVVTERKVVGLLGVFSQCLLLGGSLLSLLRTVGQIISVFCDYL